MKTQIINRRLPATDHQALITEYRSSIAGYLIRLLVILLLTVICAGVCPHPPAQAASNKKSIPPAVRVVLIKVSSLINQKAYDRAIETLEAFKSRGKSVPASGESDPKGYHHPEIYFALGTCHLLTNNYQWAVQAFEQVLKQDPTHISAWLNLAKAAYELKDYSWAAHCFSQAYLPDKNPEHLYYSAVAYLMAQRSKPSIAAFEKLFKNHPDKIQPAWRENFVHALLSADFARRALPHIRLLAEHYTDEKQVQWQEILLHQYMQLDMQEQARTYALFLTRQAPTRAKWWKALAHVYLQDGNYKPALTAFTIYSHLEPLTDQETNLLADLHLQLGIPVKAAPLYAAVLQKKIDARLLHNLMLALQQLGRPEEALKALRRSAPDTKDPNLLMLKADLLYNLERYAEAAQAYRQTAETDTKQKGRAWLMAGYAALQANDVEAGRNAFKQAATFDRHRKAALLAMGRLPKTR
jgi:tetratricopeptide (TPR) repeat protein